MVHFVYIKLPGPSSRFKTKTQICDYIILEQNNLEKLVCTWLKGAETKHCSSHTVKKQDRDCLPAMNNVSNGYHFTLLGNIQMLQ